MGSFSTETILVIEKTLTEDIVNIVHEIMLKNNFTIGYDFDKFYFEDTDPDSDIDDSKWVESETMEDALKTLEEFKKHSTGGSYSYQMDWGYNEQGQKMGYDVSVSFLSFDTKNIEAIMFSVREGVFEIAHEKELKKVFSEINERAKIIAATQKTDYYTEDYHWLAVIEEILSGNIHTKYEYKFTE